MSQSEDYLDGLLNSITKAKTDVTQLQEDAYRGQDNNSMKRQRLAPEDDFLNANGIDTKRARLVNSHPYLRRAFSESDFLKEFEDEIDNGLADSFIDDFEAEIDEEERIFEETGEIPEYNAIVDSLLNNINTAVSKAQTENTKASVSEEENSTVSENEDIQDIEVVDDLMDLFKKSSENNEEADAKIEETVTEKIETEEPLFDLNDDSEVAMEPLDETSNLQNDEAAHDEFAPDEMDQLDAQEFSDDEPDLSDGLDLDNLLSDDDMLDIQSLIDGDGEIDENQIDESVEADESNTKKGKKNKKGKKKEKKEMNPILKKILTIIFGEDEEEEQPPVVTEIPEANDVELSEMSEEDLAVLANLEGATSPTDDKKDKKDKKKKEKKEKPKKEPKPKKQKPAKPPKPPKKPKPKKVDNSPKIPLSIVATFLIMSCSMIGVVLILMNYMGVQRHMKMAQDEFVAGNYISSYEKLNGLNLSDEDDILLRNQARTMADIQQCVNEYDVFIANEMYDFALDSLIKGIGRYEKYKDDAIEYNISQQYDECGNYLISQADSSFGLSQEAALDIFHQKNRHYYTIELRKVLINLGLDE